MRETCALASAEAAFLCCGCVLVLCVQNVRTIRRNVRVPKYLVPTPNVDDSLRRAGHQVVGAKDCDSAWIRAAVTLKRSKLSLRVHIVQKEAVVRGVSNQGDFSASWKLASLRRRLHCWLCVPLENPRNHLRIQTKKSCGHELAAEMVKFKGVRSAGQLQLDDSSSIRLAS